MSGGSAPGWLRGLSDAVLVIAGFRLGSVFPCHSRLHARAGSVGRRSANGDSVRTAVRELFVEDIREARECRDQKHQRCIGAYRQPRRYRVVAPTCLRRDTDVTATARVSEFDAKKGYAVRRIRRQPAAHGRERSHEVFSKEAGQAVSGTGRRILLVARPPCSSGRASGNGRAVVGHVS